MEKLESSEKILQNSWYAFLNAKKEITDLLIRFSIYWKKLLEWVCLHKIVNDSDYRFICQRSRWEPKSNKFKIQLGEKKDWTKRDFRSKTTLITGGVYGTWVNPPFCKITTFFHRSLALSMPIHRNFQLN